MSADLVMRQVPKPPPGVQSVELRIEPDKREVSIVVKFTDPDVYKAIDQHGVTAFVQKMKTLVYPE
jgi:16S rRNA A1518/A1519 N6-dimethyltransferase RsmA/KsgA/DIM1 with predicted DNA glycosylase/AP lyase activity